jgi:hypothetical protein
VTFKELKDLIRRLAKISDPEGYLTVSFGGHTVCYWCTAFEPHSWEDHDDDCPGREARIILNEWDAA